MVWSSTKPQFTLVVSVQHSTVVVGVTPLPNCKALAFLRTRLISRHNYTVGFHIVPGYMYMCSQSGAVIVFNTLDITTQSLVQDIVLLGGVRTILLVLQQSAIIWRGSRGTLHQKYYVLYTVQINLLMYISIWGGGLALPELRG